MIQKCDFRDRNRAFCCVLVGGCFWVCRLQIESGEFVEGFYSRAAVSLIPLLGSSQSSRSGVLGLVQCFR